MSDIRIEEHTSTQITEEGEVSLCNITFQYDSKDWEAVKTKDGAYLIRKKVKKDV